MDIAGGVIEFGTEAVLRYREISGVEHDNELPEAFLGGFIGDRLYDRFGVHVRVRIPVPPTGETT
jgi:hypothetical protein